MPEIVKMKPLIFAPRSIIAWQRGLKDQTRRLVRPQPLEGYDVVQSACGPWVAVATIETYWRAEDRLRQPYAVGDLLWIQEALVRSTNHEVLYEADKTIPAGWDGNYWNWVPNKLPAMFMPRWACRYYVRVVSVRAERLQDVSVEDCVAEGMPSYTRAKGVLSATPPDRRWWYIEWWEGLHKKLGTRWKDNPWVWVYGLEAADASIE